VGERREGEEREGHERRRRRKRRMNRNFEGETEGAGRPGVWIEDRGGRRKEGWGNIGDRRLGYREEGRERGGRRKKKGRNRAEGRGTGRINGGEWGEKKERERRLADGKGRWERGNGRERRREGREKGVFPRGIPQIYSIFRDPILDLPGYGMIENV
jgi:hypothetical protein